MFGYINSEYRNSAKMLSERWESDGVMQGMDKRTKRDKQIYESTSVMLENQSRYNEQGLASTGSEDIAGFRRIAIPTVRRFFPTLIAHHIVGVQPMLGPQALIYYLRFRAGMAKGDQPGVDTDTTNWEGDGGGRIPAGNQNWDLSSLQQRSDGSPVIPIWYTSQRVNHELRTGIPATTPSTNYMTFAFGLTPVISNGIVASPSDAADNLGVVAGEAYTAFAKIYKGTALIGYITVKGTTVTFTDNAADSTYTVSGANSAFNIEVGVLSVDFGATVAGVSDLKLENLVYAYNMQCNPDLPSIVMVVEDTTIKAQTRKLRFQWSNEAQQDVRAQHNVDIEAEFTNYGADFMALETDREIIEDVRDNAGTVAVWDFATALGDTTKEKYESLFIKFIETSNQIRKKTMRAEANFIVCSPEVYAILASATVGFAAASTDGNEGWVGVQYVGTVNNRYRVFMDPSAPRNQILMGYRGDNLLDTGYFFCPYVALVQSNVLVDAMSGCPTKILMTRYGKVLLREGARFYGRIEIVNFFV